MAQAAHFRKNTSARSGLAGSRKAGRASRATRRLPAPYSAVVFVMAYGTAITLLVGAVGVTQLIRDGVGVTHEEARLASAGSAHHHEAGSKAPPSPLNMSVEARHLGGMLVDIRADVSMNKSASALTGAKVVAYTDMAEMPGAHKQGPLPLTETPGKPGIYETQGHMPMPGKYKVRVVVTKPIRDVEQTTVSVGTMY